MNVSSLFLIDEVIVTFSSRWTHFGWLTIGAVALSWGCASGQPTDQKPASADQEATEAAAASTGQDARAEANQEASAEGSTEEPASPADSDEAPEDTTEATPPEAMMAAYTIEVDAALDKNWQTPDFSAEKLERLSNSVQVFIDIEPDGHIAAYRFLEKSGNKAFDDSIAAALDKFKADGEARLPLPETDQVRQIILDKGLRLTGWSVEKL